MVPRAIARSTLLTATKPLNSFVRPRASRMVSLAMAVRTSACTRTVRASPVVRRGLSRSIHRLANAHSFTPGPARGALFDERVDTLGRVRIGHVAGHHFGRDRIRIAERPVDLAIERALAEGHHRSAPRNDPIGEELHRAVELRRLDDAIDEPPVERGARIDRLA